MLFIRIDKKRIPATCVALLLIFLMGACTTSKIKEHDITLTDVSDGEFMNDEMWNRFVDFVVDININTGYENLNDIQKIAYLCFWYDAEVQNGGHLQFFLNESGALAKETEAALIAIGADEQAVILCNALDILNTKGIPAISSVGEYVDEAMAGKFDESDMSYYACETPLDDLLMDYVTKHQEEIFLPVE